MPEYSEAFLELCKKITAKRPRTVIEHILKYGQITTEELKEKYGYNHPPRAVRDVREHGVPVETFRVTGSDGRKIAAYRFGDIDKARAGKLKGRTVLSKKLKEALLSKYGSRCCIYREELAEQELQIDHRVPFEISGDETKEKLNPDDFMLLSGSANRAKSWCCEHCENWLNLRKRQICTDCYWAYPEKYSHIAMRQIRRVDLLWQGDATEEYEQLKEKAAAAAKEMPEFIKEIIRKVLLKNS